MAAGPTPRPAAAARRSAAAEVRHEQAATLAAAAGSRLAEQRAVAQRAAAQRSAAQRRAAQRAAAARTGSAQVRTSFGTAGSAHPVGASFAGMASWYGAAFAGRRTASGTIYHPDGLTAASRTLPLGTRLRVCRGAHCVLVTVTDRGPYVAGRILDLSRGAARDLGMLGVGVAAVTATPVG